MKRILLWYSMKDLYYSQIQSGAIFPCHSKIMAIRGVIVICDIFLFAMVTQVKCASPGYSYSKFMGPVSGIEQKVEILSDGKYREHDYVAKPDYHFEYGVEDPKTNVHQKRQETRLGDSVQGEYSVLDPDGKLRTVKYTADKESGFQASIITDGHVVHLPAAGNDDEPHDDYDDAESHDPPQSHALPVPPRMPPQKPEVPYIPHVPMQHMPHIPHMPHMPHIPKPPQRPVHRGNEPEDDGDDDEYADESAKNDDDEDDEEPEGDRRINHCDEDDEYSSGCESGSAGEAASEEEDGNDGEAGSDEASNAEEDEYY